MGLSTSLPNSVVQPGVCTSTTRPASPYKGQTIYETDTGRLLVYYGVTTGWQLPWGQPWGVLGVGIKTSNQTGIGATAVDVSQLSVTWTAVANRYYRTSAIIPVFSQASANSYVVLTITDGASTVKQQTNLFTVAGYDINLNTFAIESNISAGSTTRKARIATTAGSGVVSSNSSIYPTIIVEDIGPSTSTAPTA